MKRRRDEGSMRPHWATYLLMLGLVLGVSKMARADDDHENRAFLTIDFPDAAATFANDINSCGDIVGRYNSAGGQSHGFLLSGGEFITIDAPASIFTAARGINSRGDISGIYDDSKTGRHGFVIRDGYFSAQSIIPVRLSRAPMG